MIKKTLLFVCASIVMLGQINAQNALDIDGSNDVVQTTYSGVSGAANRTFEVWIYIASTPGAIFDLELSVFLIRKLW